MQFIAVIALVFGGFVVLFCHSGARAPSPHESAIRLCQAVEGGNLERMQEMMRERSDPNSDGNGFSPLYYAAVFGLDRAATALILGGADVSRVEQDGSTPSMVAATQGNNAVLSVRIRAGGDINFVAAGGRSALKDAILGQHQETVRLLICAGAKSAALGDSRADLEKLRQAVAKMRH